MSIILKPPDEQLFTRFNVEPSVHFIKYEFTPNKIEPGNVKV